MLNKIRSWKIPSRRSVLAWAWALTSGAATVACGSEDEGITYRKSVRPLLVGRCTICHYTNGPIEVDIENPFAQTTGLVNSDNSWALPGAYPGLTPLRNVVPGDPDSSFLMEKIVDPAVDPLPEQGGGDHMPPTIQRLTDEEIASVEQWIRDGAQNDAFFQSTIVNIFGNGTLQNAGKCSLCHYPGTPNPPNLVNPFDPEEGVVSVNSLYRSDLLRVAPGDPENSFLVVKIKATGTDSQNGANMPYNYSSLTPEEVDVVSQWITLGARND